jgi:hypothetical protein
MLRDVEDAMASASGAELEAGDNPHIHVRIVTTREDIRETIGQGGRQ